MRLLHHLELLERRAFPVGHVSKRKDGEWHKAAPGRWERVPVEAEADFLPPGPPPGWTRHVWDTGPEHPFIDWWADRDTVEDQIRGQEHEHLVVFDRRGRQMFRLTDRASGHVAVQAERVRLLRMHGQAALTHNHPRGGCLSTSDVVMSVLGNLREMRAVTADGGAWVMRRPDGGGWGIPVEDDEGGSAQRRIMDLGQAVVTRAHAVASRRMDEAVRVAGGVPGQRGKGFDDGKWNVWYAEAMHVEWNRALGEAGLRFRVEREEPRRR